MIYTESIMLGLLIAALLLAFAALVAWGGYQYIYWERREISIVAALGILLAVPASIGVYHLDTRQRQVTLFEQEIDAADAVTWRFVFHVESPNIEHKLRLAPKPYFLRDADQPISLAIALRDGPDPPLEAIMDFPLRVHYSGRDNLSRAKHVRWESAWMGFIPSETGAHELTIELLEGVPEKLLIRIEDPTKKDGKRADTY